MRGRADRRTARDHFPRPAINRGTARPSWGLPLSIAAFVTIRLQSYIPLLEPNFLRGVLLQVVAAAAAASSPLPLYGIGQPAETGLDSRYQLSLSICACQKCTLDFARSLHTSLYMTRQYRQALS